MMRASWSRSAHDLVLVKRMSNRGEVDADFGCFIWLEEALGVSLCFGKVLEPLERLDGASGAVRAWLNGIGPGLSAGESRSGLP